MDSREREDALHEAAAVRGCFADTEQRGEVARNFTRIVHNKRRTNDDHRPRAYRRVPRSRPASRVCDPQPSQLVPPSRLPRCSAIKQLTRYETLTLRWPRIATEREWGHVRCSRAV